MANAITEDMGEETRTTAMEALDSRLSKGQESEVLYKALDLEALGAYPKPGSRPTAPSTEDELLWRLKTALHRDVRYCAGGNIAMRRLAAHQDFRNLYEGAKVGVDAEIADSDS